MSLKLAVNMPVSVVARPDFVATVRDRLPRDESYPGLIVEVTEDEVVAERALVAEIATQLKLYGVGLSIDDFGTAYSALSRLLDVPFVEAKLDRRFVDGCSADGAKRTLCRTMIDLAHRFDAHACAEGIEDPTDLAAIATMQCDTGQGFLLGRPMPAEAFARAVSRKISIPSDPRRSLAS